ncbi:hypothetical protein KVR01_005021 [Diaporthe batatas]|uniref:uncharacterized protein n=1 Tax=Diaporthe batatas TaxID=748121 RepID=UPI001D04490B|nr:uncharacterized protein KVR01_005021 [Diaporthe batatas]KAG8164746.1 hypothetical protein KVR01_005021 [Diaporthe batatas]
MATSRPSTVISQAQTWLLLSLLAIFVSTLLLKSAYQPPTAHLHELRDLSTSRVRLSPENEVVNTGFPEDLGNVTSQLMRRAGGDYSCKKGVPCKTQACCGSFFDDVGTCGFGPTFCGSDCDSQCDAKPECGQFADPPGKTCPLNVCCSEFGFCGSTADFCQTGCQSNCVLEPPVPAGGSSSKVIDNKVIGYYEAWSARRKCRTFPPDGIPIEGLTHVNFAFAYIDPDTLQVTNMDSETPTSLFATTTDIKNLKSRGSTLEVFVSIGGWTFSDNGTATQPVFPAIASDAGKRKQFADNLVSFMMRYGFDGVDLDWEYPGAPDRGGLEEKDIQNFVLLLKTLRETFLASARGNYGLTFTIPTSYWYLRWFDVPALLEYADWTNMMSYDLHGVWDEHNPIGSIVQSHTNLTEIKLAANLLWRNNVPPGKVVLGVGFYGRSFQLADSGCSTPGCAFSGPAKAGECTNSAGTLAYFEIMDIINAQNPKVTHDEEAAANYIVFGDNNDQWISYDDAKTLKQKVDWADSVGLGGVMIWSVDQDDADFTALEGLLGQTIPSFEENLKRAEVADTNHWSSVNGQGCKVSDCLSDLANPPSGFSTAPNGKFQDTCGSDKNGQMYKYVYCPTDAMPQSCQWRGSGSCHGQCHTGEVTLAHSPHGDKSCVKPGQQAFCCESETWSSFTDKCGWGNDCDECPSDAPYSVNTRKKISFFSSCTQHYCCPYNFQNCHWVGKGTCDDNECSATDVQVGLDDEGDTGSVCVGQWASRKKPLCCNTPDNLNPFLPVPLEKLFPTLPPSSDVPAFDQQTLSQLPTLVGANPNPNAFFFVVIDGPPGTVSNVNKRDGSHLEFLTGGMHHGQDAQTTHFVCMDNSATSNCNDMHLDGLEGTVLRMPDNMGFATYAVAHAAREVTNVTLPSRIARRAPPGARVYELEYSYNFSKVKRDSGDIYLRVDYSDTHTYYTDIVQAPHQKRFWSTISSVWKTILDRIRGQTYDEDQQPTLSKDNFDVLIYGDDGKDNGCSGADGFLKLSLSGSMRNVMRFGFTLVGTIQPFALEEAYGYFDSDLYMSAQLNFDGKGHLDINGGSGVSRSLFSSPVTKFQASHPGIVSFSPELNAEVSLVGSGQVDGKFSVSFESGSSKTIKTHAPPQLATFDGDMLANTISDAADGYIDVQTPSFNTIFAMNMNLETSMKMKIFDYGTSLQAAGATFSARTPHAIRIIGDTGTGKPGLEDAPQQASSDVVQDGTVRDGWDDGTTHGIGSMPSPAVVLTGGEAAPNREVPDINGYAVFGDKDFMTCSDGGGGSYTGHLVCYWNLVKNDSTMVEPDPPYKRLLRREWLEPLTGSEKERLDSGAGQVEDDDPLHRRAAGPSGGASESYPVYEYPANPNGPTNAFNFETPTYPAGNDGAALDAETGRNERYALNDPDDCEDTTIVANGVQGVNWETVDSDHIDDRSIFPNHFLNFAQSGELDLADDDNNPTIYRTANPTWDFANLLDYFAADYRTWVPANVEPNPPPGSAAGDVADSMGSTNNPNVMVNLETNLNILKGRIYTTEGQPVGNDVWAIWMQHREQGRAQAMLSALRASFGMFAYMRANSGVRNTVFADRRTALEQFDRFYAATFPNRPERMVALIDEFQPQWQTRVINFVTRSINSRLDDMVNLYTPDLSLPVGDPAGDLARDVLGAVSRLRARIAAEISF